MNNERLHNCIEALKLVAITLQYCKQQDMRENYIDLKREIENNCDPDVRLS